ncbi:MAG: succinate dehydrogenase cytochrome b subunit [Bacteroidales bacterium]|jgi:succinate dehydrogenase / fumarate reductase cytochrome b subunit|nr:succinate dehydrogenase cytochrome b subunit [Bacteroidales bacterium]
MPKLPKFLQFASITKKITLALIGLFLMLFLLTHLGINLCLLRNDGGEWFRAAAHFMGTNYIVKVFEVMLFGAIGLHILLALIIQFHNWMARPVGYASGNKSKTAFGSKLMIWSGLLVALFLVVHLVHFWFAKVGWTEGIYTVKIENVEKALGKKQFALNEALMNTENENEWFSIQREFMELQNYIENDERFHVLMFSGNTGQRFITNLSKADIDEMRSFLDVKYEPDFYYMARDLFSIWWVVVMYFFFMVALGFHLAHAFPSAFQTLGAAHSKYTPIIKFVGISFAMLVSVGFAIIPIFFYFCK